MHQPDRTGPPHRSRGRTTTVNVLAIATFVLLLFPPLTWIVGGYGIWYFLVTGTLGVLAVVAMYLVDAKAGRR